MLNSCLFLRVKLRSLYTSHFLPCLVFSTIKQHLYWLIKHRGGAWMSSSPMMLWNQSFCIATKHHILPFAIVKTCWEIIYPLLNVPHTYSPAHALDLRPGQTERSAPWSGALSRVSASVSESVLPQDDGRADLLWRPGIRPAGVAESVWR